MFHDVARSLEGGIRSISLDSLADDVSSKAARSIDEKMGSSPSSLGSENQEE